MAGSDQCSRVLVAGGGLAALEAVLTMRGSARTEDLPIAMLAPEASFASRPMATKAAVGHGPVWRMELGRFARDHDVELVAESLASVDVNERVATTSSGAEVVYSELLVAVGARRRAWLEGAITFGLTEPGGGIALLLQDLASGAASNVAFVVPPNAFWTPLVYELALLIAGYARAASLDATVSLVTPESAPLAMFGPRASLAVAQRLRREQIEVRLRANADAVDADRVVTLPALSGPAIDGLPADPEGFLPIDERGRITGTVNVYAAGDTVAFPIKQAGLTARQADAAADTILADRDLRSRHRLFPTALEGLLTPDEDFLDLRDPRWADDCALRPRSIWWPPPTISAPCLSPYLQAVHGECMATNAPPPGGIPVHVDLASLAGTTDPEPANAGMPGNDAAHTVGADATSSDAGLPQT
jgi:sulfide:quinone oxidoreductase